MDEGRAELDARLPAQVLRALRAPAHAQLGRRHVRDLLRRHLLLHQAHRPSGRRLGRAARLGQGHLREAGHPRGRAQVPRRGHRPVRVRGRVPPQPRGPRGARASSSATWTRRCASTRRSCKPYFGTVIPKNDNKFAALNSSVWSGGSFIYVPPGVNVEMPLQAYFRINAENMGQFERTLIIADEGSQVHYIEGCSAPVYTTDSLHSAVVEIIVKPQRPGHLHDHPELVEQRLQPGHQAGPGRDRGPHGVDRRQHRQPPHHEVPGGLHGRAQGVGRGALGGLRRARPAPGRRRQDGPRRARDHLEDRVQVDLQGRRPHQLPRPGPGRGRRLRLQEPRAVRRADPRRRLHVATPSPTWRSAPATRSSATRPPCRRWPTSSSST